MQLSTPLSLFQYAVVSLLLLTGCRFEKKVYEGLEFQWLASEVVRDSIESVDTYASDLHTVLVINRSSHSKKVRLRYTYHSGPFYFVQNGDTLNMWVNNGESLREIDANDSIMFFIRTDRMPNEFSKETSPNQWNTARLFFFPDRRSDNTDLDSIEIFKIRDFQQGSCLPLKNVYYDRVTSDSHKNRE